MNFTRQFFLVVGLAAALAAEATNIRFFESGSAGHSHVDAIPDSGGASKAMLLGGIGTLVIGLVLGVVGFLPEKKPAAAAA